MRLTWYDAIIRIRVKRLIFNILSTIMSGREVSRPYHNIILIRGFSP